MNKKWNVIITTLFITLIIWIIWLIVTKYLLNLIQVSSENQKYYKAYYISYGWIELELWKLKNHGMWFSDEIKKDSTTITSNFSWYKYHFSSKVISSWNYITNNPQASINSSINCKNKKNRITLWTWEAFLTPLIYDNNKNFSWINYEQININWTYTNIHYSWNLIISFQSNQTKHNENINNNKKKNINQIFNNFNSYKKEALHRPFLAFGAIEPSKLCIENTNNKLILPYSYIQSKWNFMNRTVQLKVIKENDWANFSIYWIY